MSFDANALFASLVISSIGLGLFVYAKRARRLPHGVVGVTMLAYTYFVGSVPWMLAIGAGLLGCLWLAVRLGL